MITFVTAYINYYKTPIENSTHQLRLSRFTPLLESNIPLCIFVTQDCVEILHQYLQRQSVNSKSYTKLIVLKESFFESSSIYLQSACKNLPKHRFPPKDTFDFMCYGHTKIEFLRQTCQINPFHTEFFAWIDYDIANMFHDKDATLGFLQMIANAPITNRHYPSTEHETSKPIHPDHHVYIPGCFQA